MLDNLILLIPALPLVACVLLVLFGRALGEKAHWPVVLACAGSSVLSLLLLLEVKREGNAAVQSATNRTIGYEHTVTLWTLTDVPDAYMKAGAVESKDAVGTAKPLMAFNFNIDVTLRADALTSFMLCMVTFIATLVAIYASGYMHGDPGYPRFFTYVALFVFSMTMLVSVSNFLLLYVFWEAVGLCSYLLIGFWYEKPEAAAAGKKAFLVNRVGDFGFAIGLFLLWTTYGTLNYHDTLAPDGRLLVPGVLGQTFLANPALYAGGGIALAICLLLMAGACGKSAQFPLHVWLPDAMEGPTPVSALIHAATMVTAGVYMVARCTPLFMASAGVPLFTIQDTPIDAQMIVAVIGGFTALMAGLIALTQTDLKRVLAYSTVSQLGYMFLSLGTGTMAGVIAGMFHLLTHAFFKALLFLGSGSVMHAMGGVIDMRRFSGLRKLMPVTCITFLVGCLALAGIFPLSGFWSKDEILGAVHDRAHGATGFGHTLFTWLYWAGMFTAGLTAFYTFRAFFLTFFGEERVPHEAGHHAHESPPSMTVPLCVLAVFAAFIGGIYALNHGIWHFLQLTPSLAYSVIKAGAPVEPVFHTDVAAVSSIAAVVGIALAAYLYLGDRSQAAWLAAKLKPLYLLSLGKFFIDQFYNALILQPLKALGAISYWFDRFVVDNLVNLVGAVPAFIGAGLRSLQNGMVQFYALAMMLGLLVLIGALVLWPGG